MLIRKAPDLRFSDITPRLLYLRRREFLQTAAGAALGAAAAVVGSPLVAQVDAAQQREGIGHGAKLANVKKSPLSTTGEMLTSFDDITSYNNFYEYGPYKEDPKAQAWRLKPRPWTITVEGYAAKKGTFGFDEFTQPYALEERVYRMRCVEAWSMVIPWVGIPLKDIIATFGRVLGKDVRYEEISDGQWRSEAQARGLNAHALEHLSSLWKALRAAGLDPEKARFAVTDTIEKLGGAKPKTFESFVREGQSELMAKTA